MSFRRIFTVAAAVCVAGALAVALMAPYRTANAAQSGRKKHLLVVTVTKGKLSRSVISCAGRTLGTYLLLADAGHGYPSSRGGDLIDATNVVADFFAAGR